MSLGCLGVHAAHAHAHARICARCAAHGKQQHGSKRKATTRHIRRDNTPTRNGAACVTRLIRSTTH
eukprot:3393707-Alexandrium_andersonii.AAC.1